MQTIVPDGQPECPNGETCYLLLSIATLHRYMMFRIGFSTVVLTWFDNLMLWKKSGEKPSPQCTVYSSKIVSYDLAGDASALGWWKNKTLTVVGGSVLETWHRSPLLWKGEAGWNNVKPWLWKIWGWVFNWFGPLMFSRWGGDCYVGLSFFVWRLTIQRDWQPVIASFWLRWRQALSFQAKEKEPEMWDGRKAMLFSDHVSSKHFLIFLACCLHTFQSCSWIELKM